MIHNDTYPRGTCRYGFSLFLQAAIGSENRSALAAALALAIVLPLASVGVALAAALALAIVLALAGIGGVAAALALAIVLAFTGIGVGLATALALAGILALAGMLVSDGAGGRGRRGSGTAVITATLHGTCDQAGYGGGEEEMG